MHLVDSHRHCPITFSSRSIADNERKFYKDFQACIGDKCINKKCFLLFGSPPRSLPLGFSLVSIEYKAKNKHSCVVLQCTVLNCEGGVPWRAYAVTSPYVTRFAKRDLFDKIIILIKRKERRKMEVEDWKKEEEERRQMEVTGWDRKEKERRKMEVEDWKKKKERRELEVEDWKKKEEERRQMEVTGWDRKEKERRRDDMAMTEFEEEKARR